MAKDGLGRQGCCEGHSPRSVSVLPGELKALVRRNALKLVTIVFRTESELLASAVGRAFSTSQNRQSRAGCALGMSFGHSGLSEPRDLGRSRRQYDREKRRDGRLDGESHRSGPDRHLAEICRRSGATEYGYPYF